MSHARRACPTPSSAYAERAHRVRVGRDRDLHARLAGEPRVRVAHVEPVGLGVDLERGARLRGPLDDALDVDRSAVALQQAASREVADAVDVRVVDRPRMRSVGLRSNDVWSEATTQSSSREHLVLDVERPVRADVRLDPAEDAERLQPLVDLLDLLPLRLEPAVAEVVRVVGQAEEAVAAALRGAGHLLDRGLPVRGPGRVAVQLAAEIAELDERRELAVARGGELSASPSRSSGGR